MKKHTLAAPILLTGTGLHTGLECYAKLLPCREDVGIVYKRVDLAGAPTIQALASNVHSTARCTSLQKGELSISTIEHIQAALYMYGIDNLIIECNAPEVPIKDGSSLLFCNEIEKVGIEELPLETEPLKLTEPIVKSRGESYIVAVPSESARFTVVVDYGEKVIGVQSYDFDPTKEEFKTALAPARTFAFMKEIQALLEHNLARGGSLDNALIVDESGYSSPLRLSAEPARHKCLDLIGDLSLAGRKLQMHVIAIKPGHSANTEFAKELQKLGGQTWI